MNTPFLARDTATALRIVLKGLKSDRFGALVPPPPALDAPTTALEQLRDWSVLLRVLTSLDPVFFNFQDLQTPDVGQEQTKWIWSRVTSRIVGWLSKHGYEEMVPSVDLQAQGQGSISNRQILDPPPIEPTPRDPASGGPALVLSASLSAKDAAEEELKGSYKMVLVKPKWANLDPSAPDVLEYRWVCSTCGTRGVRALVLVGHLEAMQGKNGHPQREMRVTGKIRSKSFQARSKSSV